MTETGHDKSDDDHGARATLALSIVIPAYNDADLIEATLEAVSRFLDERGQAAEVLVVDDGSTDSTARLVEGFRPRAPWLRLIRLGRNQGKGAAVRAGVLQAQGEVVLFSDADLSTPLSELDRLLERLEGGCEVAIGSRALPDSRVTRRQRALRERAGQTFNVLVRLMVLEGFRDTQCGFKAFRREAARAIFERQRARGFEFDVELLCLARQLGLPVAEVPVTWRNHPTSHVRFLRDSARMFVGLLALRRRFARPERDKT